jgi:hypothetical protein
MKKIAPILCAATAVLLMTACRKNQQSEGPLTKAQLITRSGWKLTSFGYDYNNNGKIESHEENIVSCMKDNNYYFDSNGTGLVIENGLICNSNLAVQPFRWSLVNNETEIDLFYGILKIMKLTRNEMELTDAKSLPFIYHYTH